jgi:hypothetical protein
MTIYCGCEKVACHPKLWWCQSEQKKTVPLRQGFGGHPSLSKLQSEGWWSRSGSNRRPLECHPISACDYSLQETGNPKNVRTSPFLCLGHVSTWLHPLSDKKRTVIAIVRLIGSQEVRLNPSILKLFFYSVRELSVSFSIKEMAMEKRLKCLVCQHQECSDRSKVCPYCGHVRCERCKPDAFPNLADGCCSCRKRILARFRWRVD